MAPRFHDVLGGLDGHPGLSVPETFGQDISSAYDDDLAEATAGISSSAEAKVAGLTTELVTAQEAIAALKSQNYDLLMSVASTAPAPDVAGTDAETPDDPDDENITTDDLFDKKES